MASLLLLHNPFLTTCLCEHTIWERIYNRLAIFSPGPIKILDISLIVSIFPLKFPDFSQTGIYLKLFFQAFPDFLVGCESCVNRMEPPTKFATDSRKPLCHATEQTILTVDPLAPDRTISCRLLWGKLFSSPVGIHALKVEWVVSGTHKWIQCFPLNDRQVQVQRLISKGILFTPDALE